VDADELYLNDTVGGASKKLSWGDAKATLKTYFDTLYSTFNPASPGPIGGTTPDTINATALTATGATVAGGTVTASAPVVNVTQTWNNAAVTFVGNVTNITSTASATASLIEDWKVGGSSKASIRKDGAYGTQDAWLLGSSFGGHPALGYYRLTETNPRVVMHVNGVQVSGNSVGHGFTWSGTDPNAAASTALGMVWSASGVIEVNNGTTGTFRDIKLRNLISSGGVITPSAYTTATRPAWVNGNVIFDSDLDKLVVGGVAAWEVVTSV